MGKRGKRRVVDAAAAPELTGVARLLTETPTATLDLHGLTADQAERRLGDFVRTHTRISPGGVVHVITGRGSRSEGDAVLPGVAGRALAGDLAAHVSESAGLPGGGGIVVRLLGA